VYVFGNVVGFSALQRAEIAEMTEAHLGLCWRLDGFSALQRAEIAEIKTNSGMRSNRAAVSVLFNEPKLLKSHSTRVQPDGSVAFQCSSTSRNC